jgi:hypothetical protein
MISLNHSFSRHPYPWYRVKKFRDLCLTLFKGSPSAAARNPIAPNTALEEKAQLAAFEKVKSDRMTALLNAFVDTVLKALRIYSGTSITSKSLQMFYNSPIDLLIVVTILTKLFLH